MKQHTGGTWLIQVAPHSTFVDFPDWECYLEISIEIKSSNTVSVLLLTEPHSPAKGKKKPGPLFTKPAKVLRKDLAKSRSLEIGCYGDRVALIQFC